MLVHIPRGYTKPDTVTASAHASRNSGANRYRSLRLQIWCSSVSHPGLPARHGLKPDLVLNILTRVCASFDIVGADIVEVAPPLGAHDVWADEPACRTAAQYLTALVNQCDTGAS